MGICKKFNTPAVSVDVFIYSNIGNFTGKHVFAKISEPHHKPHDSKEE